jgi:hypothetical protein
MDPDAALREIRALVHEQLHGDKPDPDRLAELIDGLDGWLDRGGFLPRAWILADHQPISDEQAAEDERVVRAAIGPVASEGGVHWHGLRRCTQAHPWPGIG